MNPFLETYYVVIELSNLCNYAYMHKKCPASQVVDKKILPSKVVYDILDTLGKYDYGVGRSIAFYLYSDSLNDPRLFKFLEYASRKCPKANTIIGTNGWYLNEVMAEELYEAGTTYILVSSYTEAEDARLRNVRKFVASKLFKKYPNVSFGIRRVSELDSRLTVPKKEGRCYSPLTEIDVRSNGQTSLCCMDIHGMGSYGNVLEDGFEKVILDNYDMLKNARDELVLGKRNLLVCKNCGRTNAMKWLYKRKKDPRPRKCLITKYANISGVEKE